MMQRAILFIITLFTLVCPELYAQNRSYALTRGKVCDTVNWSEKVSDGNCRTINITYLSGDRYIQTIDAQYKTTSWHFELDDEDTSITVNFKDGTYTVSGKIKGKAVNKSVESKGYPWYQSISVAAGRKLKTKGASFIYECFRPDNLELTTMVATNSGQETIEGTVSNDIKINATGAKGKFWSAHYYCDVRNGMLICYKAVEGLPGTPLTTWMLKQ